MLDRGVSWNSSSIPLLKYAFFFFRKDYVGKNGGLIRHVELIDAGIQPWIHLNFDTKYSRKRPRLMNGYFLSLSSTQSQGVPWTISLATTKIYCSFFLFPFLFWNSSNPPFVAISLSQFWCNILKPQNYTGRLAPIP